MSLRNLVERVMVSAELLKEMEDKFVKIKKDLKIPRTGRKVM